VTHKDPTFSKVAHAEELVQEILEQLKRVPAEKMVHKPKMTIEWIRGKAAVIVENFGWD